MTITNVSQAISKDVRPTQSWAKPGGRLHGDVMVAHESGTISYEPTTASLVQVDLSDNPPEVESRMRIEEVMLSPSATKSRGHDATRKSRTAQSNGREIPSVSSDQVRTPFERDLHKITYSSQLTRLGGVTQVHLNPGLTQRSRGDHCREVAAVAESIAKELHLNSDLARAIALGHDCGHGPGGHVSEDVFSELLGTEFNHARFAAEVMLAPLDLCEVTLDGIRNHSWSLDLPQTPEAEVVAFADRIAYLCHDLQDAIKFGMVELADVPTEITDYLGTTGSVQIGNFIDAVVAGTKRSGIISIDRQAGEVLLKFRKFNHEQIYQSEISAANNELMFRVLTDLVKHFENHPEDFVKEDSILFRGPTHDPRIDAVLYVAGMDDHTSFSAHQRLIDTQLTLPSRLVVKN